ncbi:MAG: 23S rRNA (uracil(1939)-C(5))-methyltransferase RlmD [Candidatus Binatia bacterium]|nr:MAG: 23S rRNA (uracil(1939)-C(5))-methyltransferase RlmD [Candidatus Binatia bacterium]
MHICFLPLGQTRLDGLGADRPELAARLHCGTSREQVGFQFVNPIVTIERMSYGPHALAHLDGKVVFVRGAVPGETVRLKIEETHATYAYARVEEIVTPSPLRRLPPCPYLPRCGGCPWQHLRYDAQLEAKQRNFRDHLQRIAKIPDLSLPAPIPSPVEFGYRSRLSLRVEAKDVGFYAAASHELVPIERCLLGDARVNDALPAIQELTRRLCSNVRRIELAADASEPQVAAAMEIEGPFEQQDEQTALTWLDAHPMVRGIVLRGKRWTRSYGTPQVSFEPVCGLSLRVRAGVFSQVNPQMNTVLVTKVRELLSPHRAERIVDAYAGAGNFACTLAPDCKEVLAIEVDPAAGEDLQENVERLGYANVRVMRDTTERALQRLAERDETIHGLVLDPPRSGAREAIPWILRLKPQRIVYVSCNSATLARDLALLGGHYRLEQATVLDLFPQTYHFEVVALLVLTC